MTTSKTCSKCKRDLPLEFFFKSKERLLGVMCQCKECVKSVQGSWRSKNKERYSAYYKKYRQENWVKVRRIERQSKAKNRDQNLNALKDYWAKIRLSVIEAYGSKCACCGETHKEFFAIDHIQGGGTREKKKYGTRPLYKRIIKEGFPKDKYQILCHNCNMSFGFHGYCPHHPEIKRAVHKPQHEFKSGPKPREIPKQSDTSP